MQPEPSAVVRVAAGQAEQLAAPDRDAAPAVHREHSRAAPPAENVPAGHTTARSEPSQTRPGGQAAHDDSCPSTTWYSDACEHLPAGAAHADLAAEPGGAVQPAGQAVQMKEASRSAYVSAGHSLHSIAPVAF